MTALPIAAWLAAFSLALAPLQAQELPSSRSIDKLIDAGRWSQAEAALERLVAADRAGGSTWYQLASVRHRQKDWEGAIEAGLRAAEFVEVRANALYNIACAQSMAGQIEAALLSLADCRAAGFLDFDLMARDSDLQALGKRREVNLPKSYPFLEFKARNKVLMNYALIKPKDYRPERAYPVLVALAPGGVRSADWMMEELWSGVDQQTEWIVVCIAAPAEKGWWTHPTHHALEDLLKTIQKEVQVAHKNFHLFAFGNGCRPALTYSGMSKKYFRSLSLVSCSAWDLDSDGEFGRYKELPVLQLIGAEAELLEFVRAAHEKLQRVGSKASLQVIPGDGDQLESLRGAKLLEAIAAVQLKQATASE